MTLLTRLLEKNIKKYQELFALIFCILFTAYLAYWSWDFVYFSFIFDDISPGLLAIPFWIPRLSMSLGVTIFLIALIDDFILFLIIKKHLMLRMLHQFLKMRNKASI